MLSQTVTYDQRVLQTFEKVEQLFDLYLTSVDVTRRQSPTSSALLTRRWVMGTGRPLIEREILRRLDLKLASGDREHLYWFLRYLRQVDGNPGRVSWIRLAIRARLQTDMKTSGGGPFHPLYVDNFEQAVYDINAGQHGDYANHLIAYYADGTALRIELGDILDDRHVRISAVSSSDFFALGPGGRSFPKVLNRGTTPNLWFAKRQANVLMDETTVGLMTMAMVPIMMVTSPPTIGGLPLVRRVPAVGAQRQPQGRARVLWARWEDYPHVELNNRTYAVVGRRLYTAHAVDRTNPSGYAWGSRIDPYATGATRGTGGKGQVRIGGRGDFGRSVSPDHVEEVIATGIRTLQQNGRTSIRSGSVEVITAPYRQDPDGIIWTVITH